MGRVLRLIETRLLPRGWMDLLRQILLFVGALVLYDLVRGIVAGDNPYKPFGVSPSVRRWWAVASRSPVVPCPRTI